MADKPLLATQRTVAAIRKADALPLYANRRGVGKIGGGVSAPSLYNGYFTVIKDGEKYWVVNGADPDALICGSFTAGSSNISCISEEIAVSGAGVIFIKIFRSGDTYDYEFGFAATLPNEALNERHIPLASISADGIPANIWTGGAIVINGIYWS